LSLRPTRLAALAVAALCMSAVAHAQSLTPQPGSTSADEAACAAYEQQVQDAQGNGAQLQQLVAAIPTSCPAHAEAMSDLSALPGSQHIGAPAPRQARSAPSPGASQGSSADDPMSGMPTPHRNGEGQTPPN
jgi:hypothetical protein